MHRKKRRKTNDEPKALIESDTRPSVTILSLKNCRKEPTTGRMDSSLN